MTPSNGNPLLEPWQTPFGLPPFERILPAHFVPAFEHALQTHRAEVDAIADLAEAPSFENTVAAFDRSGRDLVRIQGVLFNLTKSETSPALQAVEREVVPRLAAHHSAIRLHAKLFDRIDGLHRRRAELRLAPEALRLLERVHLDFVREGARLSGAARARHGEIVERLATLTTAFSQNVLADEASWRLVLRGEDDLAGLPEGLRAAARAAGRESGEGDVPVITLSRSLIVPFLTFSTRRDLREKAFKAWVRRGENDGEHDNRPIAREILALRNEQARLHGYANYADYALVDRMAGTPAAVAKLLEQVWEPAKARAAAERDALAAMARSEGATHAIEPWDWRFYADKVRSARYGFDEAELKPYFPLDRMLAAAFDTANRLFGIAFVERPEIRAYHPDVRVFEVLGRDGATVGVFLSDNFARQTKRGGAWMSAYRWQSRQDGGTIPVIVNNNNFARAPAGEQTLLSADDVRTLFHEFGHGLHGLLSQVTYERLSGTQVLRDFVELPSQIFEHWGFEPAVLRKHALHHVTGEPVPEALIERLRQARRFNQGFETVEYTACALVDMALHARTDADGVDITAFEAAELARIGMPREIVLRHRLPHFGHLFASAGYAAGYYVYLWAEVLDADGHDAFVEAGDPFDPGVAARLLRYVYASGATLEPAEAFRAFRGRDPRVGPMLAQRGLVEEAQPA
ncbi:MAG: M3 family metallopeptidase [Betaproteobacteria bacterium]|nr:M3 family metallopeptidase [Betaproteobacteria bacterium]